MSAMSAIQNSPRRRGMRTKTKFLVRSTVFIAVATMTVFRVLAGRREGALSVSGQDKTESSRKARDDRMIRDLNTLPVASYESVSALDTLDQQRRIAKSKR